jgi:hypothetical protein
VEEGGSCEHVFSVDEDEEFIYGVNAILSGAKSKESAEFSQETYYLKKFVSRLT